MRFVAIVKGLIVGWFTGGLAYLAVDGLADRAGYDLSTTVAGMALATTGAAIGGILGFRHSTSCRVPGASPSPAADSPRAGPAGTAR